MAATSQRASGASSDTLGEGDLRVGNTRAPTLAHEPDHPVYRTGAGERSGETAPGNQDQTGEGGSATL